MGGNPWTMMAVAVEIPMTSVVVCAILWICLPEKSGSGEFYALTGQGSVVSL